MKTTNNRRLAWIKQNRISRNDQEAGKMNAEENFPALAAF